jgi:type III restriction enzyme
LALSNAAGFWPSYEFELSLGASCTFRAEETSRVLSPKTWVRNTSQQPHSFWLQTASDKFYPDFVALLRDGRVLVVEYKGGYLATADDAKDKRLIGELWADRSNGRALFLMIENKEFTRIDRLIQTGDRHPM